MGLPHDLGHIGGAHPHRKRGIGADRGQPTAIGPGGIEKVHARSLRREVGDY